MKSILHGRTAIVTGASSGIGAAVADILGTAGMRVVIAARRADRLENIVGRQRLRGDQIIGVTTDVSKEEDVIRLFATAQAEYGGVDLLINNAGMADGTPIWDLSLARWQAVIEVNLTGAFLCAREAMRLMKEQRRGRIVNIGSLSAKVPRPNSSAYTASKFAIEGLTRSIAMDGRPHNVACSIFHPGMVLTELGGDLQALPADEVCEPMDAARAILAMVDLPDHVNFFEGLMLPIKTPFLGRG